MCICEPVTGILMAIVKAPHWSSQKAKHKLVPVSQTWVFVFGNWLALGFGLQGKREVLRWGDKPPRSWCFSFRNQKTTTQTTATLIKYHGICCVKQCVTCFPLKVNIVFHKAVFVFSNVGRGGLCFRLGGLHSKILWGNPGLFVS